MMSAMMGFDSQVWDTLYDKMLDNQRIPADIREHLISNKTKIREIYQHINGQWWKTGSFWQKLYRLENCFGKMLYELKQESKAIRIVLKDLDLVKPYFGS
jgi:hypothetical protein